MKALRLTTGALPLTASHPCRTINKIPLCLSVVSLSNLHGKAERDFCEANMQRICAIYSITCAANGKRYIGSTVDLTNRIYRHRYQLRHNKHFNSYLQHAWNKHGEASFAFETLEIVNETNRLERETFWIAHYKSCIPGFGYNDKDIANATRHKPEVMARIAEKKRGQKASLETRAKMSASHRGRTLTPEHRSKISAAHKGRKFPPERLEKMRQVALGRIPGPETRAKIALKASKAYIVTAPDGFEHSIVNLVAFCRTNKLDARKLSDVACGKRRDWHGWRCRHAGSEQPRSDAVQLHMDFDALTRYCDRAHRLTEASA
jgi:group I intron endonuclease